MDTKLLALVALLSFAAPALADELPPVVATDYATGYRSALTTKRLLAVAIGMPEGWYWTKEYPGHTLCRVPANHTYWPKRGAELTLVAPDGSKKLLSRSYCVLIDQPGFKELLDNPREFDAQPRFDEPIKGGGIVILDPAQGTVSSVLPRRYCTPSGVDCLMSLPIGPPAQRLSLTQRSLIWAIRMRPERPRSTDGPATPELLAHATRHSAVQAQRNWQHHNLPTGIANSEIVAESWPWNKCIVAAAVDLVDAWAHSPGHWGEVMRRHTFYGYDMRSNGLKWFATGVFAN